MAIPVSLVITMVAKPDSAGSATLVAVTVTVAGAGNTCGAVKIPEEIVPTALLPPGTPATLQVTAVSVVLATTSVNAIVFPINTELFVGESVTLTGAGTVAAVAVALFAAVRPHPLAITAGKINNTQTSAPKDSVRRCVRSARPKAMALANARKGPTTFLGGAHAERYGAFALAF